MPDFLPYLLIALAISGLLAVIFRRSYSHQQSPIGAVFRRVFLDSVVYLFPGHGHAPASAARAGTQHQRNCQPVVISGRGHDLCGLPEQKRADRKYYLPGFAGADFRTQIIIPHRHFQLCFFFAGRQHYRHSGFGRADFIAALTGGENPAFCHRGGVCRELQAAWP